MRFEPLGVTKYETNGEREIVYGFHHASMGFIAEGLKRKRKSVVMGPMHLKSSIESALTDMVPTRYELFYYENSSGGEFPEMPALNEDVPDTWKNNHCDAYNILFSNYPIFFPTIDVTKRIKVSDHFGELIVSHSTQNDGGNSEQKMKEWWQNTKKNEKGEEESPLNNHAKYTLVKAFRIELVGAKMHEAIFSVDGELFKATKLQCRFLDEKNILQACIKREKL